MHGRRSLFPDLVEPNPEIERLIHIKPDNQMAGNPEEPPRQMKEYFIPSTYNPSTCIYLPEIPASHYEIKSTTIQMLPSFYGNTNEDPYKHLDEFLEICSTVKIQNFTDDALRLTLFPFSLKDKAKYWLGTIGRPIRTWAEMQHEFLKKFYPIGRTNTMRRAITGFAQLPGEQIHESWERLKELLRKCPHHGLSKWQIVQAFYEGLGDQFRQMVDASCGGAFMSKSEDEAYALFETLSENSINHASLSSYERSIPHQKRAGIYEIKYSDSSSKADLNLIAQKLDKVDLLAQKLDQVLALGQQSPAQYTSPSNYQEICSICASPAHHMSECPTAAQFPPFIQEQVQAAQGYSKPVNDPFSNSYNSGWRNHPNFSWKPQQTQAQTQIPPVQNFQNRPQYQNYAYNRGQFNQPTQPPYQNQPSYPPPQQTNLADDRFTQLQQLIMTQQQSIARLEAQIGQIAESTMRREPGQLPSQPIANPRNNLPNVYQPPGPSQQPNVPPKNPQVENAKAISKLRSGRILKDPYQDQVIEASTDASQNENLEEKVNTETNHIEEPEPGTGTDTGSNISEKDKGKKEADELPETYKPRVPFPSALEAGSSRKKQGACNEELMELFKQVHINLPLLDAIQHVPAYAKFLKELCTQKRESRTTKRIMLSEDVSAVLLNPLPQKMKDPGAPLISCVIGGITFDRALLDLGASVNLLPTSIYKKFGIGELKPTSIILQLADRSVKTPRGLIEEGRKRGRG